MKEQEPNPNQEAVDAEVRKQLLIHNRQVMTARRERKTQRLMTKILTKAAKPKPHKPKPQRRLKNKRALVVSIAGVPVEGIEDEYIEFD